MKFEYTGRHVEVTDSIRQHVEDHFGKISDLFTDSTARAHIRIEVEKNRHIGEVVVHWREHTMSATDANGDMYQALTHAIHKIEKQAIKIKKKIVERHHSSSHTIALETTSAADGSAAIDSRLNLQTAEMNASVSAADGNAGTQVPLDDGNDDDGREPQIIVSDNYRVKPMTPEEAMMQLADQSHQFIVFRDSETQRIGVLYKRKDKNYGLIEP